MKVRIMELNEDHALEVEATVLKNDKKTRRSGAPEQEHTCLYQNMRMFCGEVANTTCKDCKARGVCEMILQDGRNTPDCSTCQCKCSIDVFPVSKIQKLAIEAAHKKGDREES